MGSCNCADSKNELGSVNVDDVQKPKNPKCLESEEGMGSVDSPKDYLLPKESDYEPNSPTQTMSLALQSVYRSLPEFSVPSTKGPIIISEGLYEGALSSDQIPDGQGRLITSDIIKEGMWESGKLNGKCRIVTGNGEVFVGNFKDNVKEGYGEFTGASDYKGHWKNDLPDGNGVEVWKTGCKYEGEYLKGLRTGSGIFLWKDGSKYEGKFKNNKIEGQGTYWGADGKMYKGSWKNNMMHGKGKFVWKDGKNYKGEYVKNEKHGFGVLTLANGKKYEGQWFKGKQHGKGVLYYKNTEKKGEWKQGKFCM